MRVTFRFAAMALSLAVMVTACGKPSAEVASATAAVDKAATESAGKYAAEAEKARSKGAASKNKTDRTPKQILGGRNGDASGVDGNSG